MFGGICVRYLNDFIGTIKVMLRSLIEKLKENDQDQDRMNREREDAT